MKLIKICLLSTILITGTILFGQQYDVGDAVPNFTIPICANGSGSWELYDYNGDQNGGNYHVIYIDIYKSW